MVLPETQVCHLSEQGNISVQQQTNINGLGRLANSSQVYYDHVNYVPIVSQSVVMSPFPASSHFSLSSVIASTCNTGSLQTDQVFDKLSMKYQYVEYVALIAKNNTDIESIEDTTTPKFGNINSVEANSVNEPSSITEDLVFDEIPHTIVSSNIHDMKAIGHDFEHSISTVAKVYNDCLCKETKVRFVLLHDTYTSNNDEEENSHDNVALFEKFPSLNTSDFPVAFACQGTVMSSASSLLAEIDYLFVVALSLRTISCWHDSPEEYRGVTKSYRRFALTFTYANAIGLILRRSALFQNSRLISVRTRPLTFWIFLLEVSLGWLR
ncbi:hypothetical protein KY290_001565 [Solanum tuberosum]|uniref:Uncharacterized protein n=1 Tax=Solanum tuberosum TaxID=4113 RepID=A0ABQ7WPT8_SOLTU|nr:hypothetical protein KY289_004223 [Solanum tuberosum]KAH0781967.1 hypothetical protein KY290_001565 [Solanum tuberosum]